ncbi:hypothetical protein CIB95_07610 [Lottiidibacillus patelloidae]|uniref:ABC transmembrane type-1 domain-containing protein n=1 Tax=Lottiidibacillus patelloidae TaxID=2670334 RepID=A0A263BUV6_9BACI|nr:M1 family aminopeptidase [Lottiidibacillus patelloidae]OZM57322.1 hypothetical protein CIB95_07610 [Lottiidibacillus patelloidae]
MKKILIHPLSLIGLLFLSFMLIASFLYTLVFADIVPETVRWSFDEKGNFTQAPYSPSSEYWLGTDKHGKDMLYKIIDGAKYTIGFGLVISFARLLIATVVAFFLRLLPKWIRKMVIRITDSFFYSPFVIIAYLMLSPVLIVYSWSFGSLTKFLMTLAVITLLAVPTLAVFISSEIEQIYQKEFVINASTLGGGKFHIFIKHVLPILKPRLFILYIQQMVNVLMIFAHLAFLEVFIGGADYITEDVSFEGEKILTKVSSSNEWAGLIGDSTDYMIAYPWIVFAPVLAFSLTILALNFIIDGLKSERTLLKRKPKLVASKVMKFDVTSQDAFSFVSTEKLQLPIVKETKRWEMFKPSWVTFFGFVSILVFTSITGYLFYDMKQKSSAQAVNNQKKENEENKEDELPKLVVHPSLANFYPTELNSDSNASYELSLKLTDDFMFNVNAKVKVTNNSADSWDNLSFYFIPNAFTKESHEKFMMNGSKKTPIELGTFANVDMKQISVNGRKTSFNLEYDRLIVPLATQLNNGETVEVDFSYTFTIPENGVRFSQYEGNFELAQWYPMLATYNAGWNINEYSTLAESYHTSHSNFKVDFEIPEHYFAATTSETDAELDDHRKTLEAKNVKEFFLTIRKKEDHIIQTISFQGIEIRLIAHKKYENSMDTLLETSFEAMRYFHTKIGEYPHKQLDIILNDGKYVSGMEYPGIVTVNVNQAHNRNTNLIKHTIVHEIAHQWFYGVINNDPYHHSWIDEGMTTLATNLFFYDFKDRGLEKTFGLLKENYYNTSSPFKHSNQPIIGFKNANVFAPLYAKPALEYWNLFYEKYEGAKTALEFLAAYYDKYAYNQVDTEEMMRFTDYFMNGDSNYLFIKWIEHNHYHDFDKIEKVIKNEMKEYLLALEQGDLALFKKFQNEKNDLFYQQQISWYEKLRADVESGNKFSAQVTDIELQTIYNGHIVFTFSIDNNTTHVPFSIVKGKDNWLLNDYPFASMEWGDKIDVFYPNGKTHEALIYRRYVMKFVPMLTETLGDNDNYVLKLYENEKIQSFFTYGAPILGEMKHVMSNNEERAKEIVLTSLITMKVDLLSNSPELKMIKSALTAFYLESLIEDNDSYRLSFYNGKSLYMDRMNELSQSGTTIEEWLENEVGMLVLVDFLLKNNQLQPFLKAIPSDSDISELNKYISALTHIGGAKNFESYVIKHLNN